MVSFTDKQISAIREFQGRLGDGDATIVKTIVLNWLISQDILLKNYQQQDQADTEEEKKGND